jgi:hypothetical protein
MLPALIDEQALRRSIARAVRNACVRVAQEQGEAARMDGLCWEGAWEVALTAIAALDVEPIVSSCERKGQGG